MKLSACVAQASRRVGETMQDPQDERKGSATEQQQQEAPKRPSAVSRVYSLGASMFGAFRRKQEEHTPDYPRSSP